MASPFIHLRSIGKFSHDGAVFTTHSCSRLIDADRTIQGILTIISRTLVAQNHPGPALLALYHGRKYKRLEGIPTLYVRDKDILATIEAAPWYASIRKGLLFKFRTMYAGELAPDPWCTDWEAVFFPPHLQLQWFLCSASQYYSMNKPFLSDYVNDCMARMLLMSYDKLSNHNHIKHCPKEALEAGGSLFAESRKLPLIVRSVGYKLMEMAEEGLIRKELA